MSELRPTNLRKVRRLNLSSRAHLVYKIHPNEIPSNGPSDYASKNEEEECLRNRFFWWRKDLVVFVIHEKQFGIDIGPVFNAPLEEQTLISAAKSTGESIVRVPDSPRKCCYSNKWRLLYSSVLPLPKALQAAFCFRCLNLLWPYPVVKLNIYIL